MNFIHVKRSNKCLNLVCKRNMVLEWKERGHEAKDFKASQDLTCINAPRELWPTKILADHRVESSNEVSNLRD